MPQQNIADDGSRQQILLSEYTAAQNSAQHHDTLVWSTSSIIWSGSLILMGFVVNKLDNKLAPVTATVLLALAILGLCLLVFVWQLQAGFRGIRKAKYDRCKEIEKMLEMEQHSKLNYPPGSQTIGYRGIMLIFASVWLVIMWQIANPYFCFHATQHP